MQRAHVIIHGRVQGVFFRAYAKEKADIRGLSGFVRNMPDGSVEVVAEGNETSIREFIEDLEEGPSSAVVQKLDVKKTDPTNEFLGFEIRH